MRASVLDASARSPKSVGVDKKLHPVRIGVHDVPLAFVVGFSPNILVP